MSDSSDENISASHGAFERLSRGVQRQLWRMKWSHLRPLQVEAIHAVLGTESPVLISAATAAGKTEAAFLPILSVIEQEPLGSVKALYVGPLRALINDQFGRLEDLCEQLQIPVHRWHGDVGAAAKRRLIRQPGGVLLLTPESLESIFVNRSPHLRVLFGALRFVVIDELHAFLGTERGRQLQSLLARLEHLCAQPPRRIGLSATLGNDEETGEPEAARRFLSLREPEQVACVQDAAQKPLGYRIHCYLEPASKHPSQQGTDGNKELQPDELAVERAIALDIARHFAGQTSLVFANARGDVEAFADLCRPKMAHDVFVHHGSLSREIREETEERLKGSAKARPVTAFCSSTLELGIDLGDVKAVGQIGTPREVSALKQRLGRSGRGEGETRVMRVYLALQEPTRDAGLFERLALPLIQTIAVTELMLDGWTEPPQEASLDLSTLTQQVLSVIAQTGGATAAEIFDRLCRRGAFPAVGPDLFARVLRCLGEKDVLEQVPTGELILGLVGERIREKRDFYAVFLTPEEFSVIHAGKALGQLPITWAPPPGEHLLFAGRRWQVMELDEARRSIHVQPAYGKKKPQFAGEQAEVHPRVRQRMREVLLGTREFAYLDAVGSRLLAAARREAVLAGLRDAQLMPLGDSRSALMLWTGDRADASVRLLLGAAGVPLENGRIEQGVGVVARLPKNEFALRIKQVLQKDVSPRDLVKMIPDKRQRKYDPLMSDDILEDCLIVDWLELPKARALMESVLPL